MKKGVSRWRRIGRQSSIVLIVLVLAATAGILYLRRDTTDEFRDAYARIDSSQVVETATVAGSPVEWVHLFDAEDGAEDEERAERVGRVIVRHPATETPPAERRTLVVYAGQQTGAALLDIIPQRPGLTLVAPLYPEIGDDGLLDQLAFPMRLRRAVYSTVASGMAGLDHVGEDRGRRIVLAASLGTAFGTLHAALDDRVDELLIVHGGGEFPAVMRHMHANRDEPVRAAVFPWIAEVLVDAYDPVRWIGEVSPRPVLLIASRHDRHFPPESIRAVYEAAGEPKELRWTGSEHVGEGKAEIVEAIMAQVEAWLDRGDEGH